MANLRANRITSTEVFETTGSVQFDGSGDYLSLSDSEDFNFGSGNFTIEGWIYLIGNGTAFILGQSDSGGANSTCTATVLINSSNVLIGRVFEGSTDYGITHSVVEKNIWNHFALVRSGSTLFLYLNGVSIQTSIGSITLNNSSNEFSIGRLGQYNAQYFNGHISNLRILKGIALYTKNFTPPTRELEVIPNTVLLCAQSKTQANREATSKTITVNGNAVASELTPGLLTNVVKSGGSSAITGSVEFDGTGDYLSLSSNDFAFGTGDFTIEYWFNSGDVSSTAQRGFFQTSDTTGGLKTSYASGIVIFQGSTKSSGGLNGGLVANIIGTNIGSSSAVITTGSWNYCALTRSSGTVRLFLNGIIIDSGSITGSIDGTNLAVGGYYNTSYLFNGFISNLRIIKGTALYTQDFIPPTRKLTKLPGTVLLCCQDSNNPTQEATGKTLTPYGSLVYNPPELVTDGGFSSASNWPSREADWTISGGVATINSANSGYDFLGILTSSTRNGELYELKFDVSNWTAGRLELSQSDSGNIQVPVTGNGSYTFRFRYTGTTNGNIGLYSYTDTTASFNLDNVSLKVVPSVPKPPFVPQIGSDGSVVFDGTTKINTPNYFYLPTGSTEQRSRGRGVFGGGYSPTIGNLIEYVQIQSTGNAQDFGDLYQATTLASSCSSSTRGLFISGFSAVAVYTNVIQYITISTTSNSIDFGDCSYSAYGIGGCSSSTRGVFAGGSPDGGTTNINTINYITIASLGNSLDFGDLTIDRRGLGSCSSPTRGLFIGGRVPDLNIIDYVTIASTGNALDFGDLTVSRSFSAAGCSSSTRGVFGGGQTPTASNAIDYVTIASTGNAQDFGDLIIPRANNSSCSNSIRGVFSGNNLPTVSNTIDFITIATTGNANDFGDTTVPYYSAAGLSDSHGGLG